MKQRMQIHTRAEMDQEFKTFSSLYTWVKTGKTLVESGSQDG